MKRCPFCAEEIQDAAVVCKHCGRDLKIVAPATAPKKTKKTSQAAIGCLGLIVLITLCGWLGSLLPDRPSQTPSSAPSSSSNRPSTVPAPLQHELALLSSNGYESESGGYFYVEGQVQNISASPIQNVTAVSTWYDKGGTFIKADDALIDYNPIMPGQISPFKTITFGNPSMSRYTVSFKRLFGGEISTRDDRKKKKK